MILYQLRSLGHENPNSFLRIRVHFVSETMRRVASITLIRGGCIKKQSTGSNYVNLFSVFKVVHVFFIQPYNDLLINRIYLFFSSFKKLQHCRVFTCSCAIFFRIAS